MFDISWKRRSVMKKLKSFILLTMIIFGFMSCGTRKCGESGIDVCGPAVKR